MYNFKRKSEFSAGDIFAVGLPDGRYGAIRVMDHDGRSTMIATTPYMDKALPDIENKILKETLVQNRFFFDGAPAISRVDGKPPKELIYIGNLKVKNKMIPTDYSGIWDKTTGIEAYYEWRWIHDRDNFEREIREDEERMEREANAENQKPKKMMKEEMFWDIISFIDEEDTEPAVKALAKLGVRSIKQFEEALSYKLFQLDTMEHARNIGIYSYDEAKDHFSADLFLYFRCAVIAKGKEFFESVLTDPALMPKGDTFEPLLELAAEAYERRTGKDFDYDPGCDYETFSNVKGW